MKSLNGRVIHKILSFRNELYLQLKTIYSPQIFHPAPDIRMVVNEISLSTYVILDEILKQNGKS